MPDLRIRTARDSDARALADIYNHYVLNSTATFDTDVKSVDERARWLAGHDEAHPVLVAESNGRVVAWGALSPWGTRCAYRHTVEISIYVAPEATGGGIGPRMSERLVDAARDAGHHAIISQVVSENGPSLKMAMRAGFIERGRLREVGRKFDRWLDVVLLELVLGEGSSPASCTGSVT